MTPSSELALVPPAADRRTPRVERAAMPTAREVLSAAATEYGVCLRLVALRVTDTVTGTARIIDVPCGATRAAVCPPCAERARKLRAAQCREGWHLAEEPEPARPVPTARQRELAVEGADLRYIRELIVDAGHDTNGVDIHLGDYTLGLAAEGVRGTLSDGADHTAQQAEDQTGDQAEHERGRRRRVRSTRRRTDAPDLPRLPVANHTIGRAYPGRDGAMFRPSLFVTLTLPSYGPVNADSAAVDAGRYDYRRAVRDAVHFGKLVDRFMQNLRRAVGWNVQYFAVVEPQKRGAPHLHAAIRGTIPRTVLRQVAAATYHQVWWPPCDTPVYDPDQPGTWPTWAAEAGGYLDPATGEILPSWADALDTADHDQAEPAHVVRFGRHVDAQGVLAGHPQAGRLIGYLTKYLTKGVAECHTPTTDAGRAHAARLVQALRYEPCSPSCPNWLLHRVQPKSPRPGMRPGGCKGAAHRAANLGYGGRRVLVSRWWSAKTLTDHRADRRAFALAVLAEQQADTDRSPRLADPDTAPGGNTDGEGTGTVGRSVGTDTPTGPEPGRYRWEYARPGDPDVPALTVRVSRTLAERMRWRRCLAATRPTLGRPGRSPRAELARRGEEATSGGASGGVGDERHA